MIWPVLVPSKGRPHGNTMKLLAESAVAYTCVVEPQDAESYAAAGHPIERLDADDRGIAYVRNRIRTRAITTGAPIWMLDDDLQGFFRREGRKMHKTTAAAALGATQEQLDAVPWDLAALDYQQFAWSATRPLVFGGYADCVVALNGRSLPPMVRYTAELKLKEDRDFAMQVMAGGGAVVRTTMQAFSVPQLGSNKGGLHEVYARQDAELDMCQRMVEKWGPALCQVVRKKSGRVDLKIKWRALRPN